MPLEYLIAGAVGLIVVAVICIVAAVWGGKDQKPPPVKANRITGAVKPPPVAPVPGVAKAPPRRSGPAWLEIGASYRLPDGTVCKAGPVAAGEQSLMGGGRLYFLKEDGFIHEMTMDHSEQQITSHSVSEIKETFWRVADLKKV